MDLLLIFAIAYFLQQGWVDAKYAAAGKTSPRWQAKLAKLSATGQPAVKPRYGSRDYFADLLADTLEAKTQRRREQAAGKQSKARGADLDVAVSEALAVAGTGEEWLDRPPDLTVPGKTPTTCDTCGRDVVVTNYDEEGGAAYCVPCVEAHNAAIMAARQSQNTTIPESPAPAPAHDGPDARIIPMFPTVKEEVPTMSEITGLQSAVAYAEGVAAAHEQHSLTGGEAYLGSLQSFEVSGRVLQLVASAQESSQIAAGTWKAAAAELSKQLIVKEAYDAVPDAGTKAFVQGE